MTVTAQTLPSANSGINASDTYCIFDLTLQGQATLSLPQAFFNASTNSTTNSLLVNPATAHYHVEAGYDVNDRMVLNVTITDPQLDPTTNLIDPISRIQIANGKMTLFDYSGNPLPVAMPNNLTLPQVPQAFLGLAAGPSVLHGMVVSNPWNFAASSGATASPSSSTVGGQPGVAASASVTISGTEHSKVVVVRPPPCPRGQICDPQPTSYTVYDSGKVFITVNGHEYDYFFGQGDSTASIAQGLVNTIQADSARVVNASVPAGGSTVTLQAANVGAAGNSITVATGDTYDSTDFPTQGPSFTASPASENLSGGVDAVPGTPVTSMQVIANVPNQGTTSWTYQSTGSTWILTNVSAGTASGAVTPTNHTAQLANMSWSTNSTGESRRAARAFVTPPEPGTSTINVAPLPGPSPVTITPSLTSSVVGTGPNVVFQHGFLQNGGAWNIMEGALSNNFNFGSVLQPSTDFQAALSTQTASLIGMVAQTGTLNNIMVGYSMGGLLTRDFTQQRPDLGLGVITVESPNNGAFVAGVPRAVVAADTAAIGAILGDLFGCFTPSGLTCEIAILAGGAAGGYLGFSQDQRFPSVLDMAPGSAYLNNLNSHTETFPRVGIEGHSNRRWIFYRLVADTQCGVNTSFHPCGRDAAAAAQIVFHALTACEIIALLFGDYDTAFECAVDALLLSAPDFFWNAITAPGGDATDGIVQGSGQVYHNATATTVISNADSHVAALGSDKVFAALKDQLDRQFHVPARGCTFSVLPGTLSFPAIGGGGSLNVSAGPGCSWTTFSSDLWLKVVSGTGTGTGMVSIVVDPNVSPFPRTGTLTIQGAVVTVSQDASGGSTFSAISLPHAVGRADGDGWSADPNLDSAQNWLSFGPYTTAITPGNYVAVYKLLIDTNQGTNSSIVQIDVNDGTTQTVLATRTITRTMFLASGEYQFFSLPFNFPQSSAGHQLEVRVFWYHNSFVKEQAVGFAPVTGTPLDLRWNAQSPELGHRIGRPDGDGWSVNVTQDVPPNHMQYGPYTTSVPAGLNLAVFRLLIDNNTADNNTILMLDVNDFTANRQLASRLVTRQQFIAANEYQFFELPFVLDGGSVGHQLEFRVYWYGLAYIKEQGVTYINLANSEVPLQFSALDPAIKHVIGRAESDGWSASVGTDSQNWLQYGPYTTSVPTGNNIAVYRLMIDNNTADNNTIVNLDVYDTTANVDLAQRLLTRQQWAAAGDFENFSVPFRLDPSSAGHQIEFRIWWFDLAYVKSQSVGWVQQH